MTSLFDPIQIGTIDAPNRILMAPLTRGRATRDHARDQRRDVGKVGRNVGVESLAAQSSDRHRRVNQAFVAAARGNDDLAL